MTETEQELKRLAEKATPGPWETAECGGHIVMAGPTLENRKGYIKGGRGQVCAMDDMDVSSRQQKANARFIAAANPAAVLALLERVRRLEEALREVHTTPREAMSLDAQMDLDRRVQRLLGLGGA